jgi:hypothetical protein
MALFGVPYIDGETEQIKIARAEHVQDFLYEVVDTCIQNVPPLSSSDYDMLKKSYGKDDSKLIKLSAVLGIPPELIKTANLLSFGWKVLNALRKFVRPQQARKVIRSDNWDDAARAATNAENAGTRAAAKATDVIKRTTISGWPGYDTVKNIVNATNAVTPAATNAAKVINAATPVATNVTNAATKAVPAVTPAGQSVVNVYAGPPAQQVAETVAKKPGIMGKMTRNAWTVELGTTGGLIGTGLMSLKNNSTRKHQ